MVVSAALEQATAATAQASGDAAVAEAIRTRGLTKVYPGSVTAVDGLDLTVRAGEIFGLLGPNGAGKTTTVGMLPTRIVPSAGTASVADVDIVANPARGGRRAASSRRAPRSTAA